MDFLDRLDARAAAVGGRVVLAEGHDPRVIEAAGELAGNPAYDVTMLCPGEARGGAHGELEDRGVEVVDPATRVEVQTSARSFASRAWRTSGTITGPLRC